MLPFPERRGKRFRFPLRRREVVLSDEPAPLVVGFDGSPDASRALDWAASLASSRPGVVLHLVQAVSLPPIPHHHAELTVAELLDQHEQEARRGLESERDRLAAAGLEVEIFLRRWLPAETVLEHAERHGAGLIVVGRHGSRPERLLLGSVSGEIAAAARAPVAVVRGPSIASPPRRVVLAFDGSPAALRAASAVASWAPGAEVLALWVRTDSEAAAPGQIPAALERAGLDPRRVETVERSGRPAEAALELVETRGADLVAAGRRGRSAWHDLLVGSVPEKLLQLAPCPVLVAH
jgi:nucleotide-binding universal stress UspA family protein